MDGNLMHVSPLASLSFPPRKRGRRWKVGLFVDASNIFLSVRQSSDRQFRIDYEALLKFAQSRGQVKVAKIYTAYDSEQNKEIPFFLAMRHLGYQIVREPLVKSYAGENHGNLDTVIAYDLSREAPYLDVIILVSGDGDFAPLVRRLNYSGKWVIVIGVEGCTSANLIIDSNEFVPASAVPGFIKKEEHSDQVTLSNSDKMAIHSSANNGR
jgi:uncharacterized protein (TIGR00288 family)